MTAGAPVPTNGHRPARRLAASEMAQLVEGYFRSGDLRPWSRVHTFDWAKADPSLLDDQQRSVVRFITHIEDHLPGYFAEYLRFFPMMDVDLDEFVHNREFYRFGVRWAQEEDAHAHVLFMYQTKTGMTPADALRQQLADEGQKRFALPYDEPVQLFTYTLVQEKATQIFYQRFAATVREPVLRELLRALIRDESRHFAFFGSVVEAYVRRFGDAILDPVKEVLRTFKMPLSSTLRDYWRWAVAVCDAVPGYDHTDAYENLLRVVQSTADAASTSKVQDLAQLVRRLRGSNHVDR